MLTKSWDRDTLEGSISADGWRIHVTADGDQVRIFMIDTQQVDAQENPVLLRPIYLKPEDVLDLMEGMTGIAATALRHRAKR